MDQTTDFLSSQVNNVEFTHSDWKSRVDLLSCLHSLFT